MGGFDAIKVLSDEWIKKVSIPERVWGVLMRETRGGDRPAGGVSIPERVWGVLMPGWHPENEKLIAGKEVWVSIPERVWGVLMHAEVGRAHRRGSVSIPERVWGVLMQEANTRTMKIYCVSIPERVWGVLMRRKQSRNRQNSFIVFQSLRGFGGF